VRTIKEADKYNISKAEYREKHPEQNETRRDSKRTDGGSSDRDVMRKKTPEIGDQDDDDEVYVSSPV
jgi:hypothetical protein